MTDKQQPQLPKVYSPEEEKKRRRKEFAAIGIIVIVVSVISFFISRTMNFKVDFPFSNTILMFILFNINMMLILSLLLLVFRNLIKLYYDRRRKVPGSKLRTKLLIAFIALTLLPSVVLFYFSIQFISTSLAFWFNAPVERALDNSLSIGQQLYAYIEDNNRFFIDRISYQVDKKEYLLPEKNKALKHYIVVSQRAFNIQAIEIYDQNANRLTLSAWVEQKEASLNITPVTPDDLQAEPDSNNIRTFTERSELGELVRSIGTVPFAVSRDKAKGYVVISTLIPPEMSENMLTISRGFEEYQQIKLMKKPIQLSYFTALSIVALLVVFCAIWFAFYLAKSITIPIMELVEGTRRVAEGDLGFYIEILSDDEIGSLVESFNTMTKDLEINRQQLALSARMLKEQNLEIEEKRQYMEIVLQNVSAGVISLDANGCIATINKSAEKMLNLDAGRVIRKSYKKLLASQELKTGPDISDKIDQLGNGTSFPITLKINDRVKSFIVHSNALKDDSGNPMGFVVVFDDLTELEKAQRMAAWREVARRIAHEVKNPLTPIALSAERLKRRYSKVVNEEVFDECTRTIIDHVDLIRNLVNAFSSLE